MLLRVITTMNIYIIIYIARKKMAYFKRRQLEIGLEFVR